MIHTVEGFRVANEAEVAVFPEFHAFSVIQRMLLILISGSSASSKPNLYIGKFLKPGGLQSMGLQKSQKVLSD